MPRKISSPLYVFVYFLIALGSLSALADPAAKGRDFADSVEIESSKSYSRLKLAVDSSFKPQFKDSASGFELLIPSASLMDIGVPFGQEDEFNLYLSQIRDSRLSELVAHESEGRLSLKGKYRFPVGAEQLAKPRMEHFDFRRDEQGRYIVDFFYQKGPSLAEAKSAQKIADAAKLKLEKEKDLEKERARSAARANRLKEAQNALRFCDIPIDRNNNIFLKYRVDRASLNFNAYFPEKVPDHLFQYPKPKEKNEEAEMVELALKLSRESKEALSVKTIEFIEKQYPKSAYLNAMTFLKANDFYRLGLEEKGRGLIIDLAKRARGTDVGLQCAAFLAVQSFKNQEWLAAMESFSDLKREMPNHPLIWLFRYGIAESLYQIKQTDQAKAEYNWLASNAPKPEIAAEAAFKVGDLYLDRNQYAQAMSAYEPAVKKYSAQLGQYPQVLMNLGEAYFQMNQWARAQTTFDRYLEYGRGQPSAWRASLRLAEIKQLQQKSTQETEAALAETINRYPRSPGAVIARLRLAPCGTHGGMDLPSIERLIASPEVKNFEGEGGVFTAPFKELVAITQVRSLISFGQDESAVKQGILHMRDNPSIETRHLLEQAMVGGIKRLLEKEIAAGNTVGAIQIYEKYGDYLPMPLHDPMVDDLKLKLAKLASDKKLGSFAVKIIEPYRRINEDDAKEVVKAFERNLSLEGPDELIARNYIEAKTKWNSGDYKKSPEAGTALLAQLEQIPNDSKFAFERDLIKALYLAEIEQPRESLSALKNLTTKLKTYPALVQIQVYSFMADTANLAQDLDFAQKSYLQARRLLARGQLSGQAELTFRGLNSAPSLNYLYQSEGETLEKQRKWKEAVALYTEAIENNVGGNHLLYAQAQALLKEGGKTSKQTASRSLEKIQQSQDDDVWKRLARDQLNEIAKEGKVDDEKRNP